MTRAALACLLLLALLYVLARLLLVGTAWAGDTAPGEALWEPQGRPVVMIQDVLRTVRPGDSMAAVWAVYAAPEGGWCSPWNPCCPGCGMDGETTPPPQPAQVPVPPSLILLTAAIAALALKGKRYA